MDNVAFRHQTQIAKKTLQYSDIGALIMGGMTKEQAREILRKAGYSPKRINELEFGKETKP